MTMTLLLALAFQASLDREYHENNCADPQNQAEMNICAGISFQRADNELNVAYQVAIAEARESDRRRGPEERSADTRPGYEATLRAAQRAWLVYREQQCTWQGYQEARGGSMEAMVYGGCMAAVTRARIDELRGGQQER